MIERIQSMLERSDTERRVMPATELYNEGWLLRLALDWFAEHPDMYHELAVPSSSRWYSEALLPSRFLARRRGDPLAEAHTHADGAIGQFRIGYSGTGDLVLEQNATHFVVLEAKLRSRLSPGTKRADGYDQAARTIACMAHILSLAGRKPNDIETLGFFVVAPISQITEGTFVEQLSKDSVRQKVSRRVAEYKDAERKAWQNEWFLPMLDHMRIGSVSWEMIVAAIAEEDQASGHSLEQFYCRCREFNRLERKEAK